MKKLENIDVLNEVYNLMLDPKITDEERRLLRTYKLSVESGCDEIKALSTLSAELRQEAVRLLHAGQQLSPQVAGLYKTISTVGQLQYQLGRGLISLGVVR